MPARAAQPGGFNPNNSRIEGDPMTVSTDQASGFSVARTDEIRAGFPALERIHHGHHVAYFDGPGGTQVPRAVVEAMADYLVHHNANTHWSFPTSAETDMALLLARESLADFLNAAPEEIAFGPNMTTLTYHLARALGRQLGAGDAIIVTELDHHANIDPWRALERERGVTILKVRMVPETGELDWNDLDRCLTDHRVKLLAIGAASNALGTINDVARAIAMAREADAISFVDAVHYAPHQLVDVRDWGCDFLACSAYKFHGPHVGVLYGKKDRLTALDLPKLEPAPETVPERLETGTQNHEGIVGAAAAVNYLASLAMEATAASPNSRRARLQFVFDAFHERGSALLKQLWEGLSAINGIKLFGPPPSAPRTPTLAFTVAGRPAAEVSELLADRGIFASHGNFYALTVVNRLGLADDGLVRLGCACYTTDLEVARVIEALHAIAQA
jgi:cysteine desulfurase family protein (TIGR01976 family)